MKPLSVFGLVVSLAGAVGCETSKTLPVNASVERFLNALRDQGYPALSANGTRSLLEDNGHIKVQIGGPYELKWESSDGLCQVLYQRGPMISVGCSVRTREAAVVQLRRLLLAAGIKTQLGVSLSIEERLRDEPPLWIEATAFDGGSGWMTVLEFTWGQKPLRFASGRAPGGDMATDLDFAPGNSSIEARTSP